MPALSAYNYCLYLLARREYSQFELQKKLHLRDINCDEIQHCLSKLQLNQLQSDERFCDSMIRYHSSQLKGPGLIKQKLQQAGIEQELIQHYLQLAQVNWLDNLQSLIEKKFHPLPAKQNWQQHQKRVRYLLSKGYSYDQINDCLPHKF